MRCPKFSKRDLVRSAELLAELLRINVHVGVEGPLLLGELVPPLPPSPPPELAARVSRTFTTDGGAGSCSAFGSCVVVASVVDASG